MFQHWYLLLLQISLLFSKVLDFSNSHAEKSEQIFFPPNFCSLLRFFSTILAKTFFLVRSQFLYSYSALPSSEQSSDNHYSSFQLLSPYLGQFLKLRWPDLLFCYVFPPVLKSLNPHNNLCSTHCSFPINYSNILYMSEHISPVLPEI